MMAFSLLGFLIFLVMLATIVIATAFGLSKVLGRPSVEREQLYLREVMDRLADVEARLDELADTDARVAELEERVDVSERVLADVRGRKEISAGD
jgi:hypothetical protein